VTSLFVTGGARSGKTFALATRLIEVVGSRFGWSAVTVDGVDVPLKAGSVIWVSAQRFSADAFRHDLARVFPRLVGVARITTPRGLLHSRLASDALVVCDDVDLWTGEDLSLVGSLLRLSLGSGLDGSGLNGSGLVGAQLVGVGADRQGPRFGEAVAVWPELAAAPALTREALTPARSRVINSHRSLAPESVVQILLEARRTGVAWHEMAVVVRSRGMTTATATARTTAEFGTESELLGALRRSFGPPMASPGGSGT
jgi:hypothetical protein